jgi:hypothetical protein
MTSYCSKRPARLIVLTNYVSFYFGKFVDGKLYLSKGYWFDNRAPTIRKVCVCVCVRVCVCVACCSCQCMLDILVACLLHAWAFL